jgi:hypothetical protein
MIHPHVRPTQSDRRVSLRPRTRLAAQPALDPFSTPSYRLCSALLYMPPMIDCRAPVRPRACMVVRDATLTLLILVE